MSSVFVKLKLRQSPKYRKMLSTEEIIYPSIDQLITTKTDYVAGAIIEDGEWFSIKDFSQKDYSNSDLIGKTFDTVDFSSLSRADFEKIDYLFVVFGDNLYFQNIPKSRLVKRKRIGCFGEEFQYDSDCNEIIINDIPDAIYEKSSDTLYFRRLESITSIFKGVDLLYREATAEETTAFLGNDFIALKNDYAAPNVKTANRKRIALAKKTLDGLSKEDRTNIFAYIGEYCPDLKTGDNAFEVGSEDELKLLLFGIEQRFYTTPVGGERRIANSVIKFGS